jgi:aspartate/methionine/tyrosine aminotransferase
MMDIAPFAVEQWMDAWETRCELNLAETCVHSLSLSEVMTIAGKNSGDLSQILERPMTYGEIRGSERLLSAISALYATQSDANVIVTHGTIGANMLVHKTLVSRGDRVVAVVPTYQQHYSIPASIGADVHCVKLRAEDNYLPDLDALRDAVTADTVLIALNNPNNPTGALMDRAMLEEIAQIAREVDAWILCDEVYRGLDQSGDGVTASIADIYEKGISTASMSKAYSLAGLRLGWIVGPEQVIEAVSIHRDYDTISVGQIDDYFATMALENSGRVLERSQSITRANLAVLERWMETQPRLSWVKPRSGTTTLLSYEAQISSHAFCVGLMEQTGVLFTPGSAFDMEGTVRIGFANAPEALQDGLPRVSDYLAGLPA